MSWGLEHPDITAVNLTGYPRGYERHRIYCEECEKDITYKTWYEDEDHDFLCRECLLALHEKEC